MTRLNIFSFPKSLLTRFLQLQDRATSADSYSEPVCKDSTACQSPKMPSPTQKSLCETKIQDATNFDGIQSSNAKPSKPLSDKGKQE